MIRVRAVRLLEPMSCETLYRFGDFLPEGRGLHLWPIIPGIKIMFPPYNKLSVGPPRATSRASEVLPLRLSLQLPLPKPPVFLPPQLLVLQFRAEPGPRLLISLHHSRVCISHSSPHSRTHHSSLCIEPTESEPRISVAFARMIQALARTAFGRNRNRDRDSSRPPRRYLSCCRNGACASSRVASTSATAWREAS